MVPRVTVAFVCWLAVFLSPSAAPYLLEAQDDPAQPPTFRIGIGVVRLDVSVLDRDRRPVEGLTAADFTVLDHGVPRPNVAFTDLALKPQALSTPGDLAAVIHTNRGRSQNVTADWALLKAAIGQSVLGMNAAGDGASPTSERGECPCGICALERITSVPNALTAAQGRRKTLLFIGERIALHHRDSFGDMFLADMAAGSYVLAVEASHDRASTRREVRFAVR